MYSGQTAHCDDERLEKVITNFKVWAEANIEEWLFFEKAVFNDECKYAGTIDAIVRLKGSKKLVLLDVKTSKKIREEYYLQVTAYCKANRMEDNLFDLSSLDGAIIVHLDHSTLTWEAVNVVVTPELFDVFKACLRIYNWRNG